MTRFTHRTARHLVAVIGLAFATLLSDGAATAAAGNAAATVQMPATRSPEALVVVTPEGRSTLHVEIVDDAAGRQKGLMGRTELAPDTGMLFDYRKPTQVTMWMKDTPLSLDMIFIADDGRVVRVAQHTTPFAETLIPSFVEVRAVLEVAAGTAQRLGIAPGARIEHPIFGTASPLPAGR